VATAGAQVVAISTDVITEGFARRLTSTCDNHPHVPPLHRGRLTWLQTELDNRFGLEVSTETIRRWFAGDSLARPAKMARLAELLGVDVAWLSLGVESSISFKERRMRDATADGAVNVVAGLIQMDGGKPAFPADDDTRARKHGVDLYAIIKGVNYSLHVTGGEQQVDGTWKFTFAASHDGIVILGLVREGMTFRIFEVSASDVETYGERRNGGITVTVPSLAALREVKSFTDRL